MTIADALVFIAQSEVGTREEGGNNRGARIRHYQEATTLAPGEWPWCAAFTAYLLREALKYEEARESLKLETEDVYPWRCRSAAAFKWIEWAERKGLKVWREDKDTDAPSELAKAGDIVVFDFSHIGIVEKDQAALTDPIATIEGNTNGKGERDSAFGDGVWRKNRKPTEVLALIRLIG